MTQSAQIAQTNLPVGKALGWIPSFYRNEVLVNCSLELAWESLLHYPKWNPTFVGATVTRVRGSFGEEGELVLINKELLKDVHGKRLPKFYAETIKVIPQHKLVWLAYPEEGLAFCDYVDFELTKTESGVRFVYCSYAQNQIPESLLEQQRARAQATYLSVVNGFKSYCENASKSASSR
jgi:hypothetical protein